MRPARRGLLGVVLVLACAALAAGLLGAPAQAAKKPGDWMKPGVPMQGQQHPDPTAVTLGPLTYALSTEHGGSDLPVAWSADLSTWTARTQYAGADGRRDGETRTGYFNDAISNPPWGVNVSCGDAGTSGCDPKTLWAPGVGFVAGRWLGYHAVKVSTSRSYSSYGRLAIYRTAAPTPFGEFESGSSRPIVTTDPKRDPAGAIDPEVFTDPVSGRTYLLYKTEGSSGGNYPKIWTRQIGADGAFVSGSRPTQLLTVTRGSWEGNVVENPSMIRLDGAYLLFYSGNRFATTRYATAYAVCRTPLGPCTKKGRILTNTRGSYGPGGADAFVDDRGRYLLAYHAWTSYSGTAGTGGRALRIAEIGIDGGKVVVRQRETTPSPRTDDGYWYGNRDGSFTTQRRPTGGTYTPFVADLDADARDDVGLYGPWAAADGSLLSRPGRAAPTSGGSGEVGQAGTFLPVSGDFDGDGRRDVYWYQPGQDPIQQIRKEEPEARVDQLWLSTPAGGWTTTDLPQDRVATPVVGDFDGDGADELWWIQPGAASDERWDWNASRGGFTRTVGDIATPGTMAPAVGDLDDDDRDDVLWYAPGATSATIWWSADAKTSTSVAVGSETRVFGRRPIIGDFDGQGGAEVLWYGPRARPDALWRGVTRQTRTPVATPAPSPSGARLDQGGTYQGLVGDFDGDRIDDVYWYG